MKRENFGILFAAGVVFLFAGAAFANEGGAATASNSYALVAAGFGLAIAAFGGALGQSRAAAAALEGIARNPAASDKLFVPMVIALALIESLVIYSFAISYMLLGK